MTTFQQCCCIAVSPLLEGILQSCVVALLLPAYKSVKVYAELYKCCTVPSALLQDTLSVLLLLCTDLILRLECFAIATCVNSVMIAVAVTSVTAALHAVHALLIDLKWHAQRKLSLIQPETHMPASLVRSSWCRSCLSRCSSSSWTGNCRSHCIH